MTEEFIKGRRGLWLGIDRASGGDAVDLTFRLKADGAYVLHWGLSPRQPGPWTQPPRSLWPAGSQPADGAAVRTPFTVSGPEQQVQLRLDRTADAAYLVFDLFCPEARRWENNQGRDYYVALPEIRVPRARPGEVLEGRSTDGAPESARAGGSAGEGGGGEVVHRGVLALDTGGELAYRVERHGARLRVRLLTDVEGPVVLHWGIPARSMGPWQMPAEALRPGGTTVVNEVAVETPFTLWNGFQRIEWDLAEAIAPAGLGAVLRQGEAGRWLKHRGGNLRIPLRPRDAVRGGNGAAAVLPGFAERIIEGETGEHGWTLMHRFNLCHELLEEVAGDRGGWATLYVWLRYSAIRQLDWQRNYNTKPRELSHAQDRLTHRLSVAFRAESVNRDLVRLCLTCLGRGGDGQRIRDEILHIMHRHHIKEVAGRFMEEWHQKLHNNTTPDDIVICEAYLAFLHSDGNLDRYFETLRAGGVTRERLESFERPIRTEPDFQPHLKHGLIHDFENYLTLLKSVHSASDLDTASRTAGPMLDGAVQGSLGWVRDRFRDPGVPVMDLVHALTHVRDAVHQRLAHEGDAGATKELLYLDLALEATLRVIMERGGIGDLEWGTARTLTDRILTHHRYFDPDPELAQCHREWQALPASLDVDTDAVLRAKSVLDRLSRAVSDRIDALHALLQPRAAALGEAFGADAWVVQLFAEEVVRGQSLFVVSLLLHRLESWFRRLARLGDWQVISPHPATGRIQVVASLREVQSRRFDPPVILVAEEVHGDEEPPPGVRGVLTPSAVDLVSHVAVRARNIRLLFATCHDRPTYDRFRSMDGQVVHLRVGADGEVIISEEPGAGESGAMEPAAGAPASVPRRRPAVLSVVPLAKADPDRVGGKARRLRDLAGRLPAEFAIPRSVCLPFGVFEAVLGERANADLARRYQELQASIEAAPETRLEEIRSLLLGLRLPESLARDLDRVLAEAGLPRANEPSAMAQRIAQVWASQWNDRAYFSRRARNWPADGVQMAVLIQEVVPAEIAFVLHTTDPIHECADDLYAELVLGLGETLVGNFPGRAMGCVGSKRDGSVRVLAYPSKSVGLFGGGLIFRSDSNAEDLEGYAGAGLYDSVLLQPPDERRLDYARSPLVQDREFRTRLIRDLTRLGVLLEERLGGPQDVEGAVVGGRIHVVQTRPQVGLGAASGTRG